MTMSTRWIAVALAACALSACKRETTAVTTPPPGPGPTNAASSTERAAPPQQQAAPPATTTVSPVEAVAVTSATIGNAVNADKRVTAASDTFSPQDTIYVTVETSGSGAAELTARWSFFADGQATRVNEETQKVPPGGPAVTEFHIRKPDGWPRGDYQVVILVNNDVAATRKFSVK